MRRPRTWLVFSVGLLMACGKPFWKGPPTPPEPAFPVPDPSAINRIMVSHSGCLGSCEIYRVCLRRDTTGVMSLLAFTPMIGEYESPYDSSAFAAISGRLLEEHFFEWPRLIGGLGIDLPVTTLSARVGDQWKRVSWSHGGAPGTIEFLTLSGEVDSVTAHQPWHFVGPVDPNKEKPFCED